MYESKALVYQWYTRNSRHFKMLTGGLLLAALLLITTASNSEILLPDLGSSSGSLSQQAERNLGEENMIQLRRAGAIFDDPELTAYINKLGRRLLSAGGLNPEEYEFFIVPSWEINAFALPGGYIGVNLGLISAARTESELASVLAHEISHVSQRHIARQLDAQRGQTAKTLAGLAATIAAAAAGNGQLASAALTTTMADKMQSNINYTRENEHEADRIGFKLLERAGFDPSGMATFFEQLQRKSTTGDIEQFAYLMTHPLTQDRIAEAQNRSFQSKPVQIPNSEDFNLILALTESYKSSGEHALEKFSQAERKNNGASKNIARYGKAAVQLRMKRYDAAITSLTQAKNDGLQHPMSEALMAHALMLAGRASEAVKLYENALQRYPGHKQLIYDYPRALLEAGREREAAEYAENWLHNSNDNADSVLHEIAAEAWAQLNQHTRSHLHLGEYYAANHNYGLAMEQLEIAIAADDAGPQKRKVVKHRMEQIRKQRNRSYRASINRHPEAFATELTPASEGALTGH